MRARVSPSEPRVYRYNPRWGGGTHQSDGALQTPADDIMLPRCSAAADAISNKVITEKILPGASDVPGRRAIAQMKALGTPDALVNIAL